MFIKYLSLLMIFPILICAQPKKGILIVSFGTSYKETRELCIESIEHKVAEIFKDFYVHRAFTSTIIRKKLKNLNNIIVDSPTEALDKMIKEGFEEIFIQPLHVVPGHEYHEVIISMSRRKKELKKLEIGRPLLFLENDYRKVINALNGQTKSFKNKTIVFVGHGTSHPSNASYSQLENMIRENGSNTYVANIEGYPKLSELIKKMKTNNEKEIVLMPLMIVAGDHAQNDIGSSEEDSWYTILSNEGFAVEIYMHGLGENEKIQQIFVDNITDLIDGKPLFEKSHH